MGKWKMVRLGDVCDSVSSNIAQKDLNDNEGVYPIYGASGLIKHVNFYRQKNEYVAVIKDGAGIGRTTLLPAQSSVIGTIQALIPRDNINTRYLYFAVSSMNLAKYYTGATIPHIYFKDYKSEILPLPPLDVQQKIADVLDKASALIELRRTQLEKLDLLIKSQFIEMFGDPEANEKGWPILSLKDLFSIRSSKRIYQNEQTSQGVPFLRVADLVQKIDGNAVACNLYISNEQYNDFIQGGLVPKPRDILVTTRGTLGKCYIIQPDDRFYFQDGMISWLEKTNVEIESVYISNLFEMDSLRRQVADVSKGATVDFLSLDKLGKLKIMYPDFSLQQQFTAFVQQVDQSKFKIQQSLSQLELNYKSLIQKYFRGELF